MVNEPQPIDEVDGSAIGDAEDFNRTVVRAGRPLVMRGLARTWPAVRAAAAGDTAFHAYLAYQGDAVSVEVFSADRVVGGRYYYSADLSGFNFDKRAMRFADAVDAIFAGADDPAGRTTYMGSVPLAGTLAGLGADFRLPCVPDAVVPRIWLGHASDVSCHYDMMDNVACVVAGRRRFTLFPPDAIGDLYVGPLDRTMAGQPVGLAAAAPASERERFPRFEAAQARALAAELTAGDALFMPKLWWHQVQGLAPVNGLINFWWDATASGPDSPHTALLLAIITLAERPLPERLAWRAFFDHYAFRPNRHPLEHLSPENHGILGPLAPHNYGRIRTAVMQALRGLRGA